MSGSLLTGVDHAWLRMHRPENPMVITGFFVFEEALDVGRLRDVVTDRMLAFSRFSQRVVQTPRGPTWEDVRVDLDQHITVESIPEPADAAAFQAFVGDLVVRPLAPGRPLWAMTVAPNHPSGCAVHFRFHHALGDGVALMKVLLSLCDQPDQTLVKTSAAGRFTSPEAAADQVRSLVGGASTEVGRALKTASGLARGGAHLVLHPRELLHRVEAGAPWARAVQHLTTLPADPPTALRRKLSGSKVTAWTAPRSLEELKRRARRHGGTLNDLITAAVAGGLRQHLGQSVDGLDLRAIVPVNLRPPTGPPRLGNYFGLVVPALPVGERDRLARLHRVQREMRRIKASVEPAVSFALLQALGHAGAAVEEEVLRFFGTKASLVMSNVPGPRSRLSLAGSEIAEMLFWVPQSGDLGLGISILSYAGTVRVGVLSDTGVVPDPQGLLAGIEEEIAAF